MSNPKQRGRVEIGCLVNSKTTQCVNPKTMLPAASPICCIPQFYHVDTASWFCRVWFAVLFYWRFLDNLSTAANVILNPLLAQPVAKLDILSTHQPPRSGEELQALPTQHIPKALILSTHQTSGPRGGMQALPTQRIPRVLTARWYFMVPWIHPSRINYD